LLGSFGRFFTSGLLNTYKRIFVKVCGGAGHSLGWSGLDYDVGKHLV